ncbi:CGNR zinc finger domain-containing protein [Bacillus benzoevorans]|uniref:Putative RNA-binding Zn ribbon-like protein n=1 Tax=Bacillus benzoevorans TaxID=1456 RepID=A0A7X0LZ09_9BACI|nr:CGNR zinc finger domain-containing protein [Bacillus benzoevorans]MBB6447989.1 putative RNA-binding Zn ribbon-like protein [Bacillus benzoevorans]
MSSSNQFPLISGHLSLDLVNTEVVRRGVRHNLLTSKDDLIEWIKAMQENDSLIPEHFSSETEEWLEQALDRVLNLRAFLREGFERVTDGYQLSNDWLAHLEKLIAKAPFLYRIIGGKLVEIPIGEPLDRLISLIALDALNLYATGELGTMKRCANPDCVLLFMDSSGRRKWCSMQICGNRKKVARFQNRSGKKEP